MNWTPYLPDFEPQSDQHFDSDDCGYFATVHCIETWLYFKTGVKTKYSARWLASICRNENLDSITAINKYGLCLLSDLSDQITLDFNSPLSSEIKALGKTFPYTVTRNYINESDVEKALEIAPILYQCLPHGQQITHYTERQSLTEIFDQYLPAIKPVTIYPLLNNFQIILTPKQVRYIKDNGQFKQVNPDGTITVVSDNWVLLKLYFGGMKYTVV